MMIIIFYVHINLLSIYLSVRTHTHRYLVCSRDLSPSEILIRQKPIVIGPIANCDNVPVCLNCYHPLGRMFDCFRYAQIYFIQILFQLINVQIKNADVRSVNFHCVIRNATIGIIQRRNVNFSKTIILQNICTMMMILLSCNMIMKRSLY